MIKHQKIIFSFIASMALLLTLSCVKVDAGNSNNGLIEKAKQVTVKYKLTTRPMECLIYEVLEGKLEGKVVVDVRERHGDKCGGDPATSPRVFSIGFDEKTNEVWSDANSLLGQFEKLGDD